MSNASVSPPHGGFWHHNWQPILAFGFGIVFLAVLLLIVVLKPDLTTFQQWFLRVVLSLVAGGVGAIIPGTLGFESRTLKATGAVVLILVVYRLNPPALAEPSNTSPPEAAGVPLGDVADLILGLAPTEVKPSQERLLQSTLESLSAQVPLVRGTTSTTTDCGDHRTLFLQTDLALVKLQTFAVPAGALRVRALSDGQHNATLVTAQNFVALKDSSGFRRVMNNVPFDGVRVYEFDTTEPSVVFIGSYYGELRAFTGQADEIGVEITDTCGTAATVTLAFAGMPFDRVEFRHFYEIPRRLSSPPALIAVGSDRIASDQSIRMHAQQWFADFLAYVAKDSSPWTQRIVDTWRAVNADAPGLIWENRTFTGVTRDLLVVAYGKHVVVPSRPAATE